MLCERHPLSNCRGRCSAMVGIGGIPLQGTPLGTEPVGDQDSRCGRICSGLQSWQEGLPAIGAMGPGIQMPGDLRQFDG